MSDETSAGDTTGSDADAARDALVRLVDQGCKRIDAYTYECAICGGAWGRYDRAEDHAEDCALAAAERLLAQDATPPGGSPLPPAIAAAPRAAIEGTLARVREHGAVTNPYSVGDVAHAAWRSGWMLVNGFAMARGYLEPRRRDRETFGAGRWYSLRPMVRAFASAIHAIVSGRRDPPHAGRVARLESDTRTLVLCAARVVRTRDDGVRVPDKLLGQVVAAAAAVAVAAMDVADATGALLVPMQRLERQEAQALARGAVATAPENEPPRPHDEQEGSP